MRLWVISTGLAFLACSTYTLAGNAFTRHNSALVGCFALQSRSAPTTPEVITQCNLEYAVRHGAPGGTSGEYVGHLVDGGLTVDDTKLVNVDVVKLRIVHAFICRAVWLDTSPLVARPQRDDHVGIKDCYRE